MSTYLEKINGRLAKHLREVERLQIAAEVVAELAAEEAESRGKTIHLTADRPVKAEKPAPVQLGGPITIRKVEPKKKSKRGGYRSNYGERTKLKDEIRPILREHGPMPSGDVIDLLGRAGDKEAKQQVYQCMYEMNRDGEATKDDEGYYRLVDNSTPPPAS